MKLTLDTVVVRSPIWRTLSEEAKRDVLARGRTSRRAELPGGRELAASVDVTLEEVRTTADVARIAGDPDVVLALERMPFLPPAAPADVDSLDVPELAPVSWGVETIGAAEVTQSAGSTVTVAVLDSGIEKNHPAFAGMTLLTRNFTEDVDEDSKGHGTHCAATIFGRDVDGKRIGVARGVRKALIGKVTGRGGGSTDTILKAIQWALGEGATVVNMSLCIDFVGFHDRLLAGGMPPQQAMSIALAGYRKNIRAFDRLSNLLAIDETNVFGAVVVAASGNESERPDFTITVAPPAAGDSFIAVGAIDRRRGIAPFSNDEVDLVAPGVGIWSAALGGGLRADSGTSMAAPHVAGIAVLWAEALAGSGNVVNATLIQERMKATAEPIAGLRRRDVGAGLAKAP